jgi:hypothetical protein
MEDSGYGTMMSEDSLIFVRKNASIPQTQSESCVWEIEEIGVRAPGLNPTILPSSPQTHYLPQPSL